LNPRADNDRLHLPVPFTAKPLFILHGSRQVQSRTVAINPCTIRQLRQHAPDLSPSKTPLAQTL
jgi:hypothetical protein